MEPEEVSEEVVVAAASGLQTSQLLVMEWTPVYVAEAGVLVGMLGGDIVKKSEVEVVGGLVGNEVKADIFEGSLYSPRLGHEPED